jgi:hypothetical protein
MKLKTLPLLIVVTVLVAGSHAGVSSAGPVLTVTGALIDDIVTSTTTTPVTVVDVAAGTSLSFCWSAAATGSPVVGYRYGWDILDPNDDEAWPMPFTPFGQDIECSPAMSFVAGSHIFYVEVIDNDGFKSRVPIQIHITAPVPTESTTWGRIKSLYR